MHARTRPPLVRLFAASLAVAIVNGCGGGTTEPTEDPTINLTINPTSATVEQGGSVEVTGTATVGGSFTGNATVTVSGVPTGVTGTVGAPSTSGNTTTVPVTVAVGAAVAPDTYTMTVTAAGSGVSSDQTFTLTVTAAPQYTLDVTPTALSIEQGTSAEAALALVRTNFTGTVNLTAEGAPAGMSVSFDPDAVTGDASTATVTVGGSVAADTYSLTIRGEATGTALDDRTVTLDVTVTAPAGPSFALSATPDELMLDQGQGALTVAKSSGPALASTGTVEVGVTRLNDHTATVQLDLVGAPEGVTASFSPDEVTGDMSTLTVEVGPTVPTGNYETSIRGQDGTLERTTPLMIMIDPAPAYDLSLDPEELTIQQGSDGTTTVNLARMNFTDEVTLVLDNAPTGVTGAFSVNPVSADASTLTLSVSAQAVPGQYDLTITGEASGLDDRSATLSLTVTEAVGFSLGGIDDITIQQGASGMRTVSIARTGGFAGEVAFAITPTPPSGLTVTVSPTSTTGNSVTLTATASASLTPQTYTFSLTGSATGQPDAQTSVDINVTQSGGGNVVLDYSVCDPEDRPLWLAFRDGSGAWTQVTGVNNVYSFSVSQPTVEVAIATGSPITTTEVEVAYMTQNELTSGMFLPGCGPDPVTKNVTFDASGLVGLEEGTLFMGGGLGLASTNGPGTINGVQLGTFDAVGFVQIPQTPGNERVFIRRDQDVTDLGAVDFALSGSETVAAASATITVSTLR